MTCFMEGDGTFLLGCQDLGLFLQTSDYAVNGGKEVLLLNSLLVVSGGNQGSLVADIGYIGT